jgi:hypothetical protein
MKTKLLTVFVVVFVLCLSQSNKSFAQRDAGGTATGTGSGSVSGQIDCITQPPPISFKRNNGQGTCGNDAEIRLSYNQHPTTPPVLIGLTYTDGTQVENLFLPVNGNDAELDKKGYISYCLTGVNINPAKKLVAIFHYDGACEDVVITEN